MKSDKKILCKTLDKKEKRHLKIIRRVVERRKGGAENDSRPGAPPIAPEGVEKSFVPPAARID